MFRRKYVLVVGSRGFIGSHLMDEIEADEIDLKRGEDVRNGIEEKYDVIVFLAASMDRTKEAYSYNHELYAALDAYMKRNSGTHVIYTSSAAVYPDSPDKQSEKSLVEPVNLYGKAKLLGEAYVQQYRKHTILRLSNVYGDDGKGAYSVFRNGGNKIFGDGSDIRDYVHVEFVVEVIKSAIHDWFHFQGITNVSTGKGTTTESLFQQHGTGKPFHEKPRRGDAHCSILDNTKLMGITR